MSLETRRLTLLPCSPEHLLTLIDEPERFEQVLGMPAADGLHGFFVSDDVSPHWLAALRTSSGPDPWRHGFFVVHRERGSVIGSAGFKGPPDSTGTVEIAYGIVPSFDGRGYATEAAVALVGFALASGQVRMVRAHTLPQANASTRVLLKCGFRHVGTVVDPDDGPVWRWERGP
jgi:RimJ/RimL family protein N-acetyltransferase